jgi:hypothetical protein
MPIIEKLKEKSVDEITQFAIYFRDYMQDKEKEKGKIQEVNTVDEEKEKEEKEWWARHNLVHGKYPNTKEMTLFPILENIFNKVIN